MILRAGEFSMGRKYANPPVAEAVCEFRVSAETAWDLTVPGLVYERIRNEFPTREERRIQEVMLAQTPEGLQQQIHLSPRALFLTEDRNSFIQVGPRLLAVNVLRPYPNWEVFRAKIQRSLEALQDVVHVAGWNRLGLRYINRIEIPMKSVDLDDYFDFRPYLGKGLPQNMAEFIVGILLPYRDGKDHCKVQFTNAAPDNTEYAGFLLDFDYFLSMPGGVDELPAMEWVDSAHEAIEDLFEGCISDRLRGFFQEIE
jgi:uncharacterized protein (TIGR04255 family)